MKYSLHSPPSQEGFFTIEQIEDDEEITHLDLVVTKLLGMVRVVIICFLSFLFGNNPHAKPKAIITDTHFGA